jgi:hypothetical protein
LLACEQILERLIVGLLADLHNPHCQLLQVSLERLSLAEGLLGKREAILLKVALANQKNLCEQKHDHKPTESV